MVGRRQQGFTLVELLVVITIIAILAGILFPVFAKARENGRKTACGSNMKQIGAAILQYTSDYDEHLPLSGVPIAEFTNPDWISWSDAILSYTKNEQIFKCPSLKDIRISRLDVARGMFPTTCVFNGRLLGLSQSEIKRPANTALLADGGRNYSDRTEAVNNRREFLFTIVGDNAMNPAENRTVDPDIRLPTTRDGVAQRKGECQRLCGACRNNFTKPCEKSGAAVHNDSGIYIFADGHVKALAWNVRPASCQDFNFVTRARRFGVEGCPDFEPNRVTSDTFNYNVWTASSHQNSATIRTE